LHSPTGGQGIATGLQDATNLAWKLARVVNGAPDRLLDTYEEERLPKAREVLAETDRTTNLFMAPSPWFRLLRDWVVLPVLRLERVQKALFHRLAQLHVHYPEASLSCHKNREASFWGTRLKAGHPAPGLPFPTGPPA